MAAVATATKIHFEFSCGLRGFHEYRISWIPEKDEVLAVQHEDGNQYDQYAVAAYKRDMSHNKTVGHLPKEISRLVTFLLIHGAQISVRVVDEKYRRSLLVQGGLEIPVKVTIIMDYSETNRKIMNKFENLLHV